MPRVSTRGAQVPPAAHRSRAGPPPVEEEEAGGTPPMPPVRGAPPLCTPRGSQMEEALSLRAIGAAEAWQSRLVRDAAVWSQLNRLAAPTSTPPPRPPLLPRSRRRAG